jgi:hypothetical protein
MVPRLIRLAKINQGPIIQPRLVGQAHTCRSVYPDDKIRRRPSGSVVLWLQGKALGSPVVPDENRMLIASSTSARCSDSSPPRPASKKSFQCWSRAVTARSMIPVRQYHSATRFAARTRSYSVSRLPPRHVHRR